MRRLNKFIVRRTEEQDTKSSTSFSIEINDSRQGAHITKNYLDKSNKNSIEFKNNFRSVKLYFATNYPTVESRSILTRLYLFQREYLNSAPHGKHIVQGMGPNHVLVDYYQHGVKVAIPNWLYRYAKMMFEGGVIDYD